MKSFVYVFSLIIILVFTLLFVQVWQNNREIAIPDTIEIQQRFDKSVAWLENNYSQLENSRNVILWWFIKQAALSSGDKTLTRLFHQFKRDHIDNRAPDISTPMFNPLYRPRMPDISQLAHLDDYQIFFFYSYSCDADLGTEPLIQKQLTPEFCSVHFLQPRCVTHQLMGLRFMQRYQCGYERQVKHTISTLQQTLITELTWDFRVTDSYIQRVLMLLDTGAYARLKPIWIKNILNAQNQDGGWDDLYPLFPVGGNKVFALGSTSLKVQQPRSNFHASAQGIWLLSMLLEQSKRSDDAN